MSVYAVVKYYAVKDRTPTTITIKVNSSELRFETVNTHLILAILTCSSAHTVLSELFEILHLLKPLVQVENLIKNVIRIVLQQLFISVFNMLSFT